MDDSIKMKARRNTKRDKQINHIKYVVDKINEEFDIDINIELEIEYKKAIARGKKPSMISQIRMYQKEMEKEKK